MKFNTWLDAWISRSGVDLDQVIRVEAPSKKIYGVSVKSLIESLKKLPAHDQAAIREAWVSTQLLSEDPMDYLRHLAELITWLTDKAQKMNKFEQFYSSKETTEVFSQADLDRFNRFLEGHLTGLKLDPDRDYRKAEAEAERLCVKYISCDPEEWPF